MARHRIGTLQEFQDATATPVNVDGTAVVVWRDGDEVHAVRNRCSHMGLSLTKGPGGFHAADGEITCPWHMSRFDLCTGENLDWAVGFAGRKVPAWSQKMMGMGRTPAPLTTYPVTREGDDLFIDV
jgi:nitrite reductase/ring-hydroxylating ferredoxin subunit